MIILLILAWFLFTIYYFRKELRSVFSRKAEKTTGEIIQESENVMGGSHPIDNFFALNSENNNINLQNKDENSIFAEENEAENVEIEAEFDVEYEFDDIDSADIGGEENEGITIDPVNRTIEELQQAIEVIGKTDASTEEEQEAGQTLVEIQETDLFAKLKNVSGSERINFLMQEFERVWNNDYEKPEGSSSDVDYATIADFNINDYA